MNSSNHLNPSLNLQVESRIPVTGLKNVTSSTDDVDMSEVDVEETGNGDGGELKILVNIDDDIVDNHVVLPTTFDQMEEEYENNVLFNKLELLSVYLNGQKTLYLTSKNIMNFRQNVIMIICISIGGVATVLSLKGCDDNALFIITVLNSLVTFLIGVAGVLKFDVIGENFLHISNSFNKLEMHIENCTSQIQLMNGKKTRENFFFKQIEFVEETIGNIKDRDNIPRVVFVIYPLLTRINIFKYVQLNRKKALNTIGINSIHGVIENYNTENFYNMDSYDIEEGRTSSIIEDLENQLSNEIKMGNRYWWGQYYFSSSFLSLK